MAKAEGEGRGEWTITILPRLTLKLATSRLFLLAHELAERWCACETSYKVGVRLWAKGHHAAVVCAILYKTCGGAQGRMLVGVAAVWIHKLAA